MTLPKHLADLIEKEAEAYVNNKCTGCFPDTQSEQIAMACYEVGASSLYSHILKEQGAGRWVKASERLPTQEWYGPIRHRYDEKHKVWEYDSCSLREMECNIENFPDVEWLDQESAPPASTGALVEALKMVQDKCYSLGIPYYAYGDNEAACAMAALINELGSIATAALAAHEGNKEQ